MGRLKQLGARLGSIAPRVRAMPKVAERFYLSAEWKAYRAWHRAETRRRAGAVWCCVCGGTERLILDHVIERKDGGADFPAFEGARWYCGGCHNTKTAKARAARAGMG
jgi:5-methylcytosine-specific restriction endonuclease McrA